MGWGNEALKVITCLVETLQLRNPGPKKPAYTLLPACTVVFVGVEC
jgi:hypothetical protein